MHHHPHIAAQLAGEIHRDRLATAERRRLAARLRRPAQSVSERVVSGRVGSWAPLSSRKGGYSSRMSDA
jgi:hypothetical protein